MIIDADAHYAPETAFDNIEDKEWLENYKQANGPFFRSQIDQYHWSLKNQYKIDRQLLNYFGPSTGLRYDVPRLLATKLMSLFNDHMISLTEKYPEFDCNIWLAMQDPNACLQELQRLDDHNFFGVHVGSQVPWGFLPQFNDIMDFISKNKIPLYVHFAGSDDIPKTWANSLPGVYHEFKKIWNNPTLDDQKLLILSLILETIPRYPDLRVVIAEHDIDWIESFCHEVTDAGYPDPYPFLRENFWFTCELETKTFLTDAQHIGWDRLLFATDAPHDDVGGANAPNDVDLINKFLADNRMTDHDYFCITEYNYKKLSSRI